MKRKLFKASVFSVFFLLLAKFAGAQQFDVKLDEQLKISSLNGILFEEPVPLFAITVNDTKILSEKFKTFNSRWNWEDKIALEMDSIHSDIGHCFFVEKEILGKRGS
jgi:hypothetical protein